MTEFRIVCADSMEALDKMLESSIHAVVCDPPYELNFMNKEWDKTGIAFNPEFWKKVLRVLKPGGYLLAFGGTQTYHRMVVAIEDAGFRICPMLGWVYGQGFPKASDVRRMIDKRPKIYSRLIEFAQELKKCRELRHMSLSEADELVTGGSTMYSFLEGRILKGEFVVYPPSKKHYDKIVKVFGITGFDDIVINNLESTGEETGNFGYQKDGIRWIKKREVLVSTTEEAMYWDGWKYSISPLKPALEPICMAQKPYEGKPLDSILKHEVGAVNIRECLVQYQSDVDKASATPQGKCTSKEKSDIGAKPDAGRGLERVEFERPEQVDRYPSNFLLVHHPDCKRVGVKKVPNKSGSVSGNEPSFTGDENTTCYGEYERVAFQKHGDPDGMETVEEWECEDGCPVKVLGEQSGYSVTKRIDKPSDCGGNTWGGTFQTNRGARGHTDDGTAVRFFPQFDYELEEHDPFCYCAKASGKERNAGLTIRNNHPTVKPLKLLRWMIRLVTRPGQIILDPFAGSGSTGCAAMLEGRNYIGIEKEDEYIEMAKSRIKYWLDQAESLMEEEDEGRNGTEQSNG